MIRYSLAALALVATSSFALAQTTDRMDKGVSSANSAAEHAPGQMKDNGSAKDVAPGQTRQEGSSAKEQSPGHLKDKSAESSDKNGSSLKSKSSENSEGMKGSEGKKSADRDMKNKDLDRNAKSEGDRDDKTKQSRTETDKKGSSTGASEGSEGRSGGKGSITGVTEEQRTKVKSVFMQHHVEPARDLNVAVNVGVSLPRTVHLYPVPEDIVLIVPEYRGYDYIMLDDNRVAIVDPESFEVVDIIVVA